MIKARRIGDAELSAELAARGIYNAADCMRLVRELGLTASVVRRGQQRPTRDRPGVWAAALGIMRMPTGATMPELLLRLLDAFPDRQQPALRQLLNTHLFTLRLLCGGASVTQVEYTFRFAPQAKRGLVYHVDGARDGGRESIRAEIARFFGRKQGATIDEAARHIGQDKPADRRESLRRMVHAHVSIWRSLVLDGESSGTFAVDVGQERHRPVFRVR